MFCTSILSLFKNLAPIRKKLGFRTIFNQIGPLVNPGGAGTHLLGVSRNSFLDLFADAILQMGKQGIVVCGGGKIDEVTLDAPNELRIIHSGSISSAMVLPTDFGLRSVSLNEIRVNSIQESAGIIIEILNGSTIPGRDVVLANTALGLLAAKKVKNLKEGVEMGKSAIDQGKAKVILEQLKSFVV